MLTVAALSFWPWQHLDPTKKAGTNLLISLITAAASCLLRPTAVIVWIGLGLHLMWTSTGAVRRSLILSSIGVGILAIAMGLFFDHAFYGHWTSTALNFFNVNVTENISVFYGSNPWHWYLSQGWPVLLGPNILLAIPALIRRKDRSTSTVVLASIISWTTFIYSLLEHKEFRFLLPMLPIALILLAADLASMARGRTRNFMVAFLLLSNASIAWYATRVHQRRVMDVMDCVRNGSRNGTIESVFFLMPCHSTPFHSHVHAGPNFRMEFLTCEPPLR
jgi:phosphatidylinositol glycan class B